ncbi:hypothetical protein KKB18_05465 [bacterium]|nr:hypothetical protein [bacterium]
MRTITIIMAICLLGLMAVPAITPVESKGSNVFADSNCPGCWAWRCDDESGIKVCAIACLEDEAEIGYYFGVEVVRDDPITGNPFLLWIWVLMVQNSTFCDSPCHEYTTAWNPPLMLLDELTGHWQIRDGYGLEGEWICGHEGWTEDPRP